MLHFFQNIILELAEYKTLKKKIVNPTRDSDSLWSFQSNFLPKIDCSI